MTFTEFAQSAEVLCPNDSVFATVKYVRHVHGGRHSEPQVEFCLSRVTDYHDCTQWYGATPHQALTKMREDLYPEPPAPANADDTAAITAALGDIHNE